MSVYKVIGNQGLSSSEIIKTDLQVYIPAVCENQKILP